MTTAVPPLNVVELGYDLASSFDATTILIFQRNPYTAHAVIRTESGLSFTCPRIDPAHNYDDEALEFTDQDRPGSTPLQIRSGLPLRTLSFVVTLYRKVARDLPGGGKAIVLDAVDLMIVQMRTLLTGPDRLLLDNFGPNAAGFWRCTSLSFEVTQMNGNNVSLAKANVTFKLASDLPQTLAAVTGGKKTSKQPVSYTVKKGDTLQKIAQRFYRDPGKAYVIAQANNIRHPSKIKPGLIITIPVI